MSYYRCGPHCGATLDPGEICDCWKGACYGAKTDER